MTANKSNSRRAPRAGVSSAAYALVLRLIELREQPYSPRRNAALWDVQARLEKLGFFNRNGVVTTTTRRAADGFRLLAA